MSGSRQSSGVFSYLLTGREQLLHCYCFTVLLFCTVLMVFTVQHIRCTVQLHVCYWIVHFKCCCCCVGFEDIHKKIIDKMLI